MTKAKAMVLAVSAIEALGVTVDSVSMCFTGAIDIYVSCLDVGRFDGWNFEVRPSGTIYGELPRIDIEGFSVRILAVIINTRTEGVFGVRC